MQRTSSRRGIAAAALVVLLAPGPAWAEVMTLRESLDLALRNYGEVKAKEARVDAAEHDLSYSRKAWLPDVMLSAQQTYGTINAIHGTLYSPGGPANASTSMPLASQSWNASFGSLYSAIAHWNVLTFGRIDRAIDLSASTHDLRKRELELERFEHQIRTAHAYLELSAAQRVKHVQAENVSRYEVVLETIEGHTASGLLPEVDASFARAELAHARALELKAYEQELAASKKLAVLLGVPFREFELQQTFHLSAPAELAQPETDEAHPLLAVHEGQVRRSERAASVASSESLPTLSVFGGVQGRGSGFEPNYAQDQDAFSHSYLGGVGVDRMNAFVGVGLSWNFTGLLRSSSSTAAEEERTRALSHEQQLAAEELAAQERFAERKFELAHDNRSQALAQRAAALDGYRQTKALYENGLGTIVDLTQALFNLSRAETDVELSQSEIWQASLLKSAASGDMNALLVQVRGANTP